MVRFMYILVHVFKLFKSITHIFPVRGHSYLANDQDFALITKRKNVEVAETLNDWCRIAENTRKNPTPFTILQPESEDFFDINGVLKAPPLKLKKFRMYRIRDGIEDLEIKGSFDGPWRMSKIRSKTPPPQNYMMMKRNLN